MISYYGAPTNCLTTTLTHLFKDCGTFLGLHQRLWYIKDCGTLKITLMYIDYIDVHLLH